MLDASNAPLYRWFPAASSTPAATRSTATSSGGRADQRALIYDSPVTGTVRDASPTASCATRWRGSPARCAARASGAATASSIYMPMVPEAVIAMLACARLGAIHSVVFGGFAAHELASRIDDARPKVIVSGSCGIEPGRVVAYKPLLDAAIDAGEHKPRALRRSCSGRSSRRSWCRARHRLGRRGRRARRPCDCVPGRGDRPALHPLHVGHDRRSRRASCATTAATPSRSLDHDERLRRRSRARSSGRPPTSAGSSATPTSSTRRCSHGCTTVLYEGKPVGTPDAGAFWRVIAQHGVGTLFTAPTAFRAIRKQDPDGRADRATTTCSRFRDALPRRRALRPGHAPLGGARSSTCR